jgi:hypothetical protein
MYSCKLWYREGFLKWGAAGFVFCVHSVKRTIFLLHSANTDHIYCYFQFIIFVNLYFHVLTVLKLKLPFHLQSVTVWAKSVKQGVDTPPCDWIYKVRQYNSWNGPVKAKFACLCTSGCCRIRNTLLVKLCISWDDGLENRFPEYLAVASHCIGCQEYQQIFVPSGNVLILERPKNCRGLSQVNKVVGQFL